MAQPSSAQREPSMEEILASIRRIIEDSDNGSKPDGSQPDVADRVAPLASAGDKRDGIADFEARFEEEDAGDLLVAQAPDTPQPEAVQPPTARIVEMRRETEAPRPVAGQPVARAADVVTALSQPAREAAPVATQEAPEPVAQETVGDFGSILSDQARKQVAASFGELSDAFAASRRRSFDEIAAEMMRPMLQEWMDNNLPLLVERLVREEIERVARGGER